MHVYMQVTAFDSLTYWPHTTPHVDNKVHDWFYVGVAKTGLPAIIVVCAGGCQGGARALIWHVLVV